jgi:hypothetical protein
MTQLGSPTLLLLLLLLESQAQMPALGHQQS